MSRSAYHNMESQDGLPTVVFGTIGGACETVGRALTRADGEKIAAELNRLATMRDEKMRERLLSEVTDAIEQVFEDQHG